MCKSKNGAKSGRRALPNLRAKERKMTGEHYMV